MTNPATGDREPTLLSCPFCGSDALGHGHSYPPEQGDVQCYDCGGAMIAATEGEAIVAWNRRTPRPSSDTIGGELDAAGMRAAAIEFEGHHRNSCYPECLDIESDIAAKAIIRAYLSALASPPEGWQDGGYAAIRKIVFDALDLSAELRDDCTADVMNALTKAGALTHSTPVEAEPANDAAKVLDNVQAWVMQQRIELKPLDPDFHAKHETLKAVSTKIRSEKAALAAQPLPKQGTGELELICEAYKKALYVPGDYPVLPQKAAAFMRTVGEILAAQPLETMQPDTYTGGNFNGVVE